MALSWLLPEGPSVSPAPPLHQHTHTPVTPSYVMAATASEDLPFHPPAGVAGLYHQLCSPLLFQQISKRLQDPESKPCCTDQHNETGLLLALGQ